MNKFTVNILKPKTKMLRQTMRWPFFIEVYLMNYIWLSVLFVLSGCEVLLPSSPANAEGVGPQSPVAKQPTSEIKNTELAGTEKKTIADPPNATVTKTSDPVSEEVVAPPAPPDFLAASQILISYVGAKGAGKRVKRSRASAHSFAKRMARSARRRFSNQARKHSDGPARGRGGYLGVWKRGFMPDAFENVVINTSIDSVSREVIESSYGFHVIRRRPLPKLVSAASILVAYKGAMRAADSVQRSRVEAMGRANDIIRELKGDVSQFASLAKQYSDAPSAVRGGNMGVWRMGQMLPDIDFSANKLEVGAISDPIETPFGYYILKGQQAE